PVRAARRSSTPIARGPAPTMTRRVPAVLTGEFIRRIPSDEVLCRTVTTHSDHLASSLDSLLPSGSASQDRPGIHAASRKASPMTPSAVSTETARPVPLAAPTPEHAAATGPAAMPHPPSTAEREDLSRLRVVPARHPGRAVLAVVVGLLVAAVLYSFVTNPRWEWGVVARWFFAESIVRGLLETLKLTALAGALGFGLGLLLALMR